MTNHRHHKLAGRERVLEMLAILQLGVCGRCGRARYATRRTARHAARISAPGARLRAYRCGDAWHLTSPPRHPQRITPPVTLVQGLRADGAGLDRLAGGERAYRCFGPGQSDAPHPAAHRSGRRSGPDPLADAPSTPTPPPSHAACGGGR